MDSNIVITLLVIICFLSVLLGVTQQKAVMKPHIL